MTCRELQEWISAELDGEARPAERQAVSRHLVACAECRRARSAAEALRQRLAASEYVDPAADARDEAVLLVLRQEGRCRAPAELPAAAGSGLALHRMLAGAAAVWCRRPMNAALAAMGLSFVLTWSALRWATSGPVAGNPSPDRFGAAAVAPRPAADRIDRWLSGAPTLAALARLERPEPPKRSQPIRRGASRQIRRHIG